MSEKRITPEIISSLATEDTIFVFGSNEAGTHGAGAAKFAIDHCGAYMHQGFGFMGQSFAIPTKDWNIVTLPLDVIEFYIKRFIAFTRTEEISRWKFYVTQVGCGLAGYAPEQIAPFFSDVIDQENIWLPKEFIDIINKKTNDNTNETDRDMEQSRKS